MFFYFGKFFCGVVSYGSLIVGNCVGLYIVDYCFGLYFLGL